jgi:predicted transcriptional regulator
LRNRGRTLIQMEILASLFESPKGPTRLAQACNFNLARIGEYTGPLLERGLIVQGRDGEKVLAISEEGYKLYKDWLDIWRRLRLD